MLQSPILEPASAVRHGFFTRQGGVSAGLYGSLNCGLGSGDDKRAVRKNRGRVANEIGVAATDLLTLFQCHSADVVTVTTPFGDDRRPRADAMVTDRPGLALAILTADCAPVLFADPTAAVVGAAHAGWRGVLDGVLEATVAAMEALGARRQRIIAAIGPTIGKHSYEVGPEFPDPFVARDGAAEQYFSPSIRGGHHMFDLPGYAAMRLGEAGLAVVADLGRDTRQEADHFFSYRRATLDGEPDYGRQISAICLTG
jgi:hypothetical protein